MSLSPGTRLGAYEILTLIGVGGMGEVYRARDTKLGRIVAVKVLPDGLAANAERIARLDGEARALASLNHPHIATLFGADESDGRYFLVMELVEGETLAERLRRCHPLTLQEILNVSLQIADALEAAHANGVVHRDLKPANIKVRRDEVVKVLDFGLAKRAAIANDDLNRDDELTHAELVTAAGTVVGTVAYMAPEVLRGEPADVRADIFSLGVILFELLTGVQPFAGRSIFEISAKILDPALPAWPAVPILPQMRAIVDRAMAKQPERRYQSTSEITRDLKRLSQSHATSTIAPPAVHSADRLAGAPSRVTNARRRWLTWTVLLTLTAAAVAGRLWLVQRATTAKEVRHKQVTFSGNVRGASIAPDGKTIAYTTAEEGSRRVLVQDVTGGRSLEIWKGELVVQVQWMRDGTQLVISGILNDETGVWIVPRLGGAARRLRDRGAHLAVSPDGRELALAFQNMAGFRITPTDEGQSPHEVLLGGFRWNFGLDWGIVSNRIAVLAGLDDGTSAILTVAPDGSGMKKVYTDKALASVRWSPVDNTLYAIRSRDGGADIIRVPDIDAATAEIVATGLPWEPADPYQRQSSLSTGGNRLVFVRAFAYANLWRLPTDGRTPPVAITTGTSRFGSPRLSPDGRWVLVSIGPASQSPIAKIPMTGGEPSPIATAAVVGGDATWSPDGTHIAFQSDVDGTPRIWLVDTTTGSRQPVPDSASPGSVEWMSDDQLMWRTRDEQDYVIRNLRTGANERLVGADSGFVSEARVAPHGRSVAMWWNRRGDSDDGLWVVQWPSRQQRLLAPGDWYPAGWSADGTWIYAYEYLGNKLVQVSVADRNVRQLARVNSGNIDGCHSSRQGDAVICTVREIHSDAWIVENVDMPPAK